MKTQTISETSILLPDLDPRDLDPVTVPPGDEVIDALVDGVDWSGLPLTQGRIRLSSFKAVNLGQVDWSDAVLYGSEFTNVDLSGARLGKAAIERCHFIGCRMTGLQLSESTLKNVIFSDCRIDYGTFTEVRATGPVAFLDSRLDHATLTRCQLGTMVMRGCSLVEAELDDCDLAGADLRSNDIGTMSGLSSLHRVRLLRGQLPWLAEIAVRDLTIAIDAYHTT